MGPCGSEAIRGLPEPTQEAGASLAILKAYRTRLKAAGKHEQVKTVERCMVLIKAGQLHNHVPGVAQAALV